MGNQIPTCKNKADNTTVFFINCLIHILLLFSILTIFFVMYISGLEKKSYKNEINNLLGNEIDKTLQGLSPQDSQSLLKILDQFDLEPIEQSFTKESDYVKINNQWLISLAECIIFFLVVIVILLFVLLFFSCHLCINVWDIVYENLIIFILVGAIEIGFFIKIAAKYVPVDPSLMTTTMINNLKQKFSV